MRATDSLDGLCCGGAPMVPLDGDGPGSGGATIDPAFAAGTAMGKRYVDAEGAEVLATKAGAGTLSVGAVVMGLKEAKPLPASD